MAGAVQASWLGPMALATGMDLSFVRLGVGVISLNHSFEISDDLVVRVGAVIMVDFGLVFLLPQLAVRFPRIAALPAGLAN